MKPERSLLILLLVAVVLGLTVCTHTAPSTSPPPLRPTVLLISIDGFRWDYLDVHEAPTLRRLADEGVLAHRGMKAIMPTKTFPNHYSIVTGLYAEGHGIVSNTMYDPDMDASFSLGNRDAVTDSRWWGGEPIWVTAEKQGQRAATYFWPGSEAPIQGIRPSFWKVYDGRVPGDDRVDELLGWLDLPDEQRPTFLTLYFSTVDSQGHRHGPEAPETAEAVAAVDGYMARLVDGLTARGLLDAINLLVVSDHGMTPVSPERVINLRDYINLDDVDVVDSGPLLALRPKAGRAEAVYAALKDAHPSLAVYRRSEIPDAWHLRDHRRIMPIVALADEGWRINTRATDWAPSGGTHGYLNTLPSMHAFFAARGPAFRQNATIPPFENIHLYPLMAHVLGLDPAPNDGDLAVVAPMLRSTNP